MLVWTSYPSGRRQGALAVTGSLQQNAVSAHKPALETHWTTVAELPTVPPTSLVQVHAQPASAADHRCRE